MTTIALVGTEGGSSRLLAAPSECGCCIQYTMVVLVFVSLYSSSLRGLACAVSLFRVSAFGPCPCPSPPLGDVPLERCARCARPPSPPSALSALLADLHRPSVVLQHTGSTQTHHHTLSTPSSLSSSLAMADFVKCVCSETGGGWLADRADGVSAVAASAHHRQKGTQMLM